ncbi:MAG TPA: carbohydrate ABC transporter permease [Candidatus Eisenbergiella merdipullorum]|uniref:Carbohydrate ABC transporter permease n=1 Tax=Candidatus Eisenbergiella merdipullorum TaxID=2838553 RepID=A0A9D2I6A0_9FIRM|nr:carbohydrate ABC transporter permease [Candidatus Eisenbergiella merdipullorum]
MKITRKKHKRTLFDTVNTSLVVLITLLVAYPLYFCVIASFSDPTQVAAGQTLLWIKDFTLEAYQNVIKETKLWIGYRNTIIYTILGTLYNLILTLPAAYVLSKKYLPFRGFLSWYFFLTMYVSGGMIPSYLLMRDLHLINNPLVLIIGAGVSCYNMIVTRQYFSASIPEDIYEAAHIDGASEIKCFTRIALPLAKPITAVMTLYYGVGHWNSYYQAMIYIHKDAYKPLQLILRDILISNEMTSIDTNASVEMIEYLLKKAHIAQGMKYAIILIASLPLLILYPFLQKYFAKGVMIGSVKG